MWFARTRQPPIRCLVYEGSVLRRELRFVDGPCSDGEVHGDVLAADGANSLLVVSEKALIHGKVKGGHVIIGGKVVGPIHCDDLLSLQPKACVVGKVRNDTLEMHRGASIDGELRSLKLNERPTLVLAASNDH